MGKKAFFVLLLQFGLFLVHRLKLKKRRILCWDNDKKAKRNERIKWEREGSMTFASDW